MKKTMINKTLINVADENSCRYPLGEINDKPEYFCGEIRHNNTPYCEVHLKLCTLKKVLDLPSASRYSNRKENL